MAYKHIVFDVDGTLLDSEQIMLKAFSKALDRVMGEGHYPKDLSFLFKEPTIRALERIHCPDIPAVLDLLADYYADLSAGEDLFPGLEQVLYGLSDQGFGLGIVTSRTQEEFAAGFESRPVQDLFDQVICLDDVSFAKPDPEPLLLYCRLAGAQAEEVLFIGDSIDDQRCAIAAGVTFALAGWGLKGRKRLAADIILRQPADLWSYLEV